MEKHQEKQREYLKRLERFFSEDPDIEQVSLFTMEELDAPMDMLRAIVTDYGAGLTDVLAEFSFIPFPGPQEVWYFSSTLTIKEDISKYGVSALSGAVARLNFYLPYGCFAVNPEGNMLIYKAVTAIRSDHDEEKIYEDIELSADTALLIPESYTDLLVKVAEGTLLLQDFIDSLPK